MHAHHASAQLRASVSAACAASRAWHAPSCGDTLSAAGAGSPGDRHGAVKARHRLPCTRLTVRRSRQRPTCNAHYHRIARPMLTGARVARCSPGGEPPARYRTVAQLSNSHTRRRARRSSVSTRSRAIGSGSTLGVGGWGVPGGRSRGPRWSRPPPVTSARRQPWWWSATIPARPHPARRARPPDHPRPGPAPARCTTGRCSCARSSPGEFWRVSRREQRLTEASAGSSDRVEEWVTLD